jgi:hypothetical protein
MYLPHFLTDPVRSTIPRVMSRDDASEFALHTMAVIAARKAAGLPLPTQHPDDSWWMEGPHVEKDERSYYVHAMGCLPSQLGRAMREHPDWYLVGAFVRGTTVELHGLDDSSATTLAEVTAASSELSADEWRLAIELTPGEKAEVVGSVRLSTAAQI